MPMRPEWRFLSTRERGDEFGGTFLFLPDADVDGIAHEFTHASFFKSGRNEKRLACAGNDEGEETFAESPTNAGEIVEGSAGTKKDGVEFRVESGHEFLSVKEA